MKYTQHKGRRVKGFKFVGVTVGRGTYLWWIKFKDGSGKWIKDEEIHGEDGRLKAIFDGKKVVGASTFSPQIKSLRAFRRRLKQWKYLPKGTELILVSRYVGCNIAGVIK